RRMRIEVGRGLEGVLTDLLAGRILDNVISPKFRTGNFDEGFIAGIEAIIQACKGEFINDKVDETGGSGFGSEFLPMIFMGSFIFLSNIFRVLKTSFGYKFPIIILIIMSIVLFGLFFAGILSSFLFIIFLLILIFAVLSMFGKVGSGRGWSSGSGWSSSSRSGGFFGGGGSFGGGGASGRW
ncbi:MAG: TPM domain-containing protein, partial [Leptospirales bacterium]|nr:TPM domain-containing protein [Leptospirales bacterium]